MSNMLVEDYEQCYFLTFHFVCFYKNNICWGWRKMRRMTRNDTYDILQCLCKYRRNYVYLARNLWRSHESFIVKTPLPFMNCAWIEKFVCLVYLKFLNAGTIKLYRMYIKRILSGKHVYISKWFIVLLLNIYKVYLLLCFVIIMHGFSIDNCDRPFDCHFHRNNITLKHSEKCSNTIFQ